MRTPLRLLVCATLLVAGCTGTPRVPPHAGMDEMWRKYSKLPPKRALAVAGDPNSLWVGAAAGGAHSQADAADRALEECRRRRGKRRMQAPCLVYAAGDTILWPAR